MAVVGIRLANAVQVNPVTATAAAGERMTVAFRKVLRKITADAPHPGSKIFGLIPVCKNVITSVPQKSHQ
jgi:hypothetical protein